VTDRQTNKRTDVSAARTARYAQALRGNKINEVDGKSVGNASAPMRAHARTHSRADNPKT